MNQAQQDIINSDAMIDGDTYQHAYTQTVKAVKANAAALTQCILQRAEAVDFEEAVEFTNQYLRPVWLLITDTLNTHINTQQAERFFSAAVRLASVMTEDIDGATAFILNQDI